MPPLGLGYIASYLRKYHGTTEINIISRSYEHDIDELVKKYRPEVVGISSTTQNYNTACSIANKIKEINKEILIVIGGAHITVQPQNLDVAMDVGVLGEGEETFSEIITAYENNTLVDSTLSNIPGIVFWREKQIFITKKRDLIRPLDLIPFPARDLYDHTKWDTIITSRGCPHKCIFCAASIFWKSVRFHSPQYVVNEIKELIQKYNVNNISILDDLFIADRKRIKEISRLIQEEGIHKKVSFFCQCHSNLINEEIIQALKSMNVTNIGIGMESGSETVLNQVKKGSVTVQQHINAIKLIKKYDINISGYFVIGAPDESKEEMLKTYEFIKNNPIDEIFLSVMIPFPGTEIWEYAKSKNLVNENMDWDLLEWDFENNKKYIIIDDAISKNDLERIYFKISEEAENRRRKGICEKTFGKNLGYFVFKMARVPIVYEVGRYFKNVLGVRT